MRQAMLDWDAADTRATERMQAAQAEAPPAPQPQTPAVTAAESTNGKPYLFSDHGQFRKAMASGQMTAADLKATFRRMVAAKEEFIADLIGSRKAGQLMVLAFRLGCFSAKTNTKPQNAAHVFRQLLMDFTLAESVTWQPMGKQTYEEAVAAKVELVTDEALGQHFAEIREEQQADEQAMSDPQTLDDFRMFVRRRGEEELTDEQLARFDALSAEASRQKRFESKPQTVNRIESEGVADLQLSIIEGFHTKRECPLWIVQLSTRVDTATFRELKAKAAQLGGRWSSFKKAEAGFQFYQPDTAQRFVGLLEGDADRTDVLEGRKERREQTAAERLAELAENLRESAQATIDGDAGKLKNTVRRAEMAAGIRARAFGELALAGTMGSIASALGRGEAVFLDGLRHKTHVELLKALHRRAKYRHVHQRHKDADERGESLSYLQREEDHDRPPSEADIRFAVYPQVRAYKRHLEEAVLKGLKTSGCKQAAAKMKRRLGDDDFVLFETEYDIEQLVDFIGRLRGHIDTQWLERELEERKRLRAANIYDVHELRSALRELIPHRAKRQADDPVTRAEDALRGTTLPGFFPTPGSVIQRMLELADVQPGHKVLEPSCGKGDILTAVLEEQPDVELTAIEHNRTLQAVLEAKGFDVCFMDFLGLSDGGFDRVVMNPPFENGADIDHVRHAYSLLRSGGTLVSVVSEGPFFRGDTKARSFREWLDDLDGETEELPEDAFRGTDSFRHTGVKTRLLVLHA